MDATTPRFRAMALAAAASGLLGCSSAYIPRPGPRLSIVMQGGSPAYVRDGKTFEGGLFGGDLDEAVRGNPVAEEYAREYQNGMIGGFAASMLGGAAMIGGATLTSVQAASDGGHSLSPVGPAVLGAGLVAYLVGLAVMFNAQPHFYDAVNAYNDGATAPAP